LLCAFESGIFYLDEADKKHGQTFNNQGSNIATKVL